LERSISIRAARTHNLKNISLELPRGKLVAVTGVSGSGKSSLVFDTLYAEGQRRYVQSLSTYARLFLERIERPDVESISDIPPAIALRQKNTIKNARSTVGTVTEVSDYLRLLFAAAGKTFCPRCEIEVVRDTVESAAQRVLRSPGLYLFLAPFVLGSRTVEAAAANLAENGYFRFYQEGQVVDGAAASELSADGDPPVLMVVVDRTDAADGNQERVREALEKAFQLGAGRLRAVRIQRAEGKIEELDVFDFDRRFNCSRCGTAFPELKPALFSPNSPLGACPECEGFGRVSELDFDKILPNHNLSLRQGLVAPWRTPAYRELYEWMLVCARRRRIRLSALYKEMTPEERAWLVEGEAEPLPGHRHRWPGVKGFFRWLEKRRYKTHVRIMLARYRRFAPCPACGGSKLKPEALNVRVDGHSLAAIARLPVRDVAKWIEKMARRAGNQPQTRVLLRELANRVGYLNEIGLGYLTIDRQARTLSGGEAQRIHLGGALGSLLSGTLYALDEPTVGLHARDTNRLLAVLRHLRDLGNTVVVVEHDPPIIRGSDFVVELGPKGGCQGGRLLYAGSPRGDGRRWQVAGRSLLMRAISKERRPGKRDQAIKILGASEHNLRGIDVAIPIGRLVCVTGVSGSGKSTLVEDVLYNHYLRLHGRAGAEAGACRRVEGLELVGDVVHMGQELPARTLRSNVATYLKIYDEIRKSFAAVPEARRLGIQARHFSFNVTGGRCERCEGTGTVTVEMHFMADLEVTCEACEGQRFQRHVLAIRLRGKNVNEILSLTVEEALGFFAHNPAITRRLEALNSVGLDYLQLGQSTSTLSGGEAQRLKLGRFLLADLEPVALDSSGRRLPRAFLMDEPTNGLSSSDIRRLVQVLDRLVGEGNTVVVIEHNLELISQADWVIDLGPGGGDEGGRLVAAGSPLKVAACRGSATGRELRRLFGLPLDAQPRTVRQVLRQAIRA
jgi:excinuclease ABC subunit A